MKLQELVSFVIGVDTHKDTHAVAVVVAATGGVERCETITATGDGYEAAFELADSYCGPTERVWAIEGTGSYSAGLTRFRRAASETVHEKSRPNRCHRGRCGSSGPPDEQR